MKYLRIHHFVEMESTKLINLSNMCQSGLVTIVLICVPL
jgi:hypothetical protein